MRRTTRRRPLFGALGGIGETTAGASSFVPTDERGYKGADKERQNDVVSVCHVAHKQTKYKRPHGARKYGAAKPHNRTLGLSRGLRGQRLARSRDSASDNRASIVRSA